jgi:hypothetical protein
VEAPSYSSKSTLVCSSYFSPFLWSCYHQYFFNYYIVLDSAYPNYLTLFIPLTRFYRLEKLIPILLSLGSRAHHLKYYPVLCGCWDTVNDLQFGKSPVRYLSCSLVIFFFCLTTFNLMPTANSDFVGFGWAFVLILRAVGQHGMMGMGTCTVHCCEGSSWSHRWLQQWAALSDQGCIAHKVFRVSVGRWPRGLSGDQEIWGDRFHCGKATCHTPILPNFGFVWDSAFTSPNALAILPDIPIQ